MSNLVIKHVRKTFECPCCGEALVMSRSGLSVQGTPRKKEVKKKSFTDTISNFIKRILHEFFLIVGVLTTSGGILYYVFTTFFPTIELF